MGLWAALAGRHNRYFRVLPQVRRRILIAPRQVHGPDEGRERQPPAQRLTACLLRVAHVPARWHRQQVTEYLLPSQPTTFLGVEPTSCLNMPVENTPAAARHQQDRRTLWSCCRLVAASISGVGAAARSTGLERIARICPGEQGSHHDAAVPISLGGRAAGGGGDLCRHRVVSPSFTHPPPPPGPRLPPCNEP
jgi:hypothetical protein